MVVQRRRRAIQSFVFVLERGNQTGRIEKEFASEIEGSNGEFSEECPGEIDLSSSLLRHLRASLSLRTNLSALFTFHHQRIQQLDECQFDFPSSFVRRSFFLVFRVSTGIRGTWWFTAGIRKTSSGCPCRAYVSHLDNTWRSPSSTRRNKNHIIWNPPLGRRRNVGVHTPIWSVGSSSLARPKWRPCCFQCNTLSVSKES